MSAIPSVTFVEFAPNSAVQNFSTPTDPAAAQSVARFEQLMYVPESGSRAAAAGGAASQVHSQGDVLKYVEQMSSRWRAGQDAIEQLSRKGTLTMNELLLVQAELVSSTVNVEISSKATDILESGVQALVQRGQ
jgi:hypothetical protein